MRKLIDKYDIVGQPPLGDLAVEPGEDFLFAGVLALGPDHDQERPLRPFRMCDTYHRGFGHRWMADSRVFDLDRADPFAAGLDHVLGAIGNCHIPVRIDSRDIASIEPAILRMRAASTFKLEVVAADPWPANL